MSSDVYLEKLREYEPLMKYASRRYSLPGVLDREDLYQEACLILFNTLEKYDLDPDSIDFRKIFKTELWHRLADVLYRFKRKKRGHGKVQAADIQQLEEEGKLDWTSRERHTPEDSALSLEEMQGVERFIETLSERLDDEARVVLSEMLYPRSWDEVPADLVRNEYKDTYWRTPRKLPRHVIASLLGMPLTRYRRAMARVRRSAVEVRGELGLTKEILGFSSNRRVAHASN